MMKNKFRKNNHGFILLFAVTLAAILLSVALGVAQVAQKEIKFGTSSKETNKAFLMADLGIECAFWNDKASANRFPVAGPASPIECGGRNILPVFSSDGTTGKYKFVLNDEDTDSCAIVEILKEENFTTIYTWGYNNGDETCDSTDKNRVERKLEVTYQSGEGLEPFWKNKVGVSDTNNNLTKTAAGDQWGNSGAASFSSISGDGFITFSTSEKNSWKMGGLSNGDTSQNYDDIDFSLYPGADGNIWIIENGSFKICPFGWSGILVCASEQNIPYEAGDVFKVASEGGQIKYYHNDSLIYTSSGIPIYPLLFDTALYTSAATITNPTISSDPNSQAPAINYIAASQASAASGGAQITINKPAATSEGQVMIASIGIRDNVSLNPPLTGGWTLIRTTENTSGNKIFLHTYFKIATNNEPSDYTWTVGGGGMQGAAGGILTFTNVDTSVLTNSSYSAGNFFASTVNLDAPSVNVGTPNSIVITSHAIRNSANWTPPQAANGLPPMIEVVDVASRPPFDNSGISIEINYVRQISNGASGTRTATQENGQPDGGVTQTIILKPQ